MRGCRHVEARIRHSSFAVDANETMPSVTIAPETVSDAE